MSEEKEIHKKIQELRFDVHRYLKWHREDFPIRDFNAYAPAIDTKFVELLILNELIHKKWKPIRLAQIL